MAFDKSSATLVQDGTVALGTATGHRHRVVGEGVKVFKASEGVCLIEAPNGAQVVHEEHDTIDLPPGEYETDNVQEFDHLAEESRAVLD